jgi:hypothetical protein
VPNPSTDESLQQRLYETQHRLVRLGDEFSALRAQKDCEGLIAAEKFQVLADAASLMGKDRLEMQESRDRVLAANCAMTQQLRDLQAIARAVETMIDTRQTFEDADEAGYISDEVTLAAANAACELERLLELHAPLYRR